MDRDETVDKEGNVTSTVWQCLAALFPPAT